MGVCARIIHIYIIRSYKALAVGLKLILRVPNSMGFRVVAIAVCSTSSNNSSGGGSSSSSLSLNSKP